jgi:hypothetical protein
MININKKTKLCFENVLIRNEVINAKGNEIVGVPNPFQQLTA